MFAAAFASSFAGRAGAAVGGFASSFALAFSGRGAVVPVGFIGPMRAQAAIVGGAAWVFDDGRLIVGGAVLIGPAGKVFAFASEETAAQEEAGE